MPSSCNDNCSSSSDSLDKNETIKDNSVSKGSNFVSLLSIPKMDCPSEENMIRLALGNISQVKALDFDLGNRQLKVFHQGEAEEFMEKLLPLKLGTQLTHTSPLSDEESFALTNTVDDEQEASTLYWLLGINGLMFVLELSLGLIAESTGLIADSLDMLADAAVYGLALYAVGRSSHLQTRAAHLAGWVQLLLALGVLVEVARRFIYGSEPQSPLMMGIGSLALTANVTCLILINRHRNGGIHMKASWIFSANDVIANIGLITAGALVAWTGSRYPDLIIGTIIGFIVLNGARRILQLKA